LVEAFYGVTEEHLGIGDGDGQDSVSGRY
jgi:hypothetical protein